MAENEVLVLFTRVSQEAEAGFRPDEHSLPPSLQARIRSYLKRSDKVASILGIQLLRLGLSKIGFEAHAVHALQYTRDNRPYLHGVEALDFNVSHSEEIVVCALSRRLHLGVDV